MHRAVVFQCFQVRDDFRRNPEGLREAFFQLCRLSANHKM